VLMAVQPMVSWPKHYLSPKLIARPVPQTGQMGVFAQEWIAPGELISIWGGQVFSGAVLAQFVKTERCYAVQVEEDLYLTTVGEPESADFINHSCQPNAGMRDCVTMVAMRSIAPGEEVCFDYAMTDCTAIDEFECACGSPLCRKNFTGNDWRLPELWARYDGYFSPYLQRRINLLKETMRKQALNGKANSPHYASTTQLNYPDR
jgi:uncharacterized protein